MTENDLYRFQKLQEHADHLLEQLNAATRKAEAFEEENFQLRAENERLKAQLAGGTLTANDRAADARAQIEHARQDARDAVTIASHGDYLSAIRDLHGAIERLCYVIEGIP